MNSFQATLVDRYRLTSPGSSKQTWYVELDVTGSGISFRPGDSLGVLPKNPPHRVDSLLDFFSLSREEIVCDPRTGCTVPVEKWLRCSVELNRVSDKMASHFGEVGAGYDVESFLKRVGATEFNELIPLFIPMRPRLYSIASGPSLRHHSIDLTVRQVVFEVAGRRGYGLCSHYLAQEAPLGSPEVEIFLQPTNHFLFPEAGNKPVVMIAPGCGVAPFRAFLQEIEAGAIPSTPCWLFFGERHRETDFLYEDFWARHVSMGHLRVDTAFSRDQDQKCYVQHRMWEHRAELWRWIENGAKLYVCGDAKRMAKDVDHALISIACDQGALSEAEAALFMRQLRAERRYLKDVY